MIQLILHLIGDYVTQSDWMAQNKTKANWPAFVHAVLYSLPFLCLTTHILALSCIFGTHFLIDRFRLARYVVWAKNWLAPRQSWMMEENREAGHSLLTDGHLPNDIWAGKQATPPWRFCAATGYPPGRPDWMSVWLLIIADNTLHLAINYAALRWL